MLLHKGFLYAVCGLFVLSSSLTILAQSGQQTATEDQPSTVVAHSTKPSTSSPAEETASVELPDSPGAVRQQAESPQQQPASPSNSNVAAEQQSQSEPSIQLAPQPHGSAETAPGPADTKQQQRPVGTAAAETPMVSGTTAAQPAGFAIAPAKQHRVRTLVIKVGAIAGAAVALGTTMALTMATPSKPPGAH